MHFTLNMSFIVALEGGLPLASSLIEYNVVKVYSDEKEMELL